MNILMSAGEVSGDMVAARLVRELRRLDPAVTVVGIGGRMLRDLGADLQFTSSRLGVVGITEAWSVAPDSLRAFRAVRRLVLNSPPTAAVLIGNDVFNVLLGRWLRGRGFPVISLFPPQVWLWRALAKPISRSFDLMLTCFPAEQLVYSQVHPGGHVRFVGHYLADELRPVTPPDRAAARTRLGLEAVGPIVGLLPGSRPAEVRRLAPVLVGAADILRTRNANMRFLLPVADIGLRAFVEAEVAQRDMGSAITLTSRSADAMRASDLLLVASGTASLEAALLGVPMVVVYAVSRVTIAVVNVCLMTKLLASKTLSLPNLILGRSAVPEIIQKKLSPSTVADEASRLLGSSEARSTMRAALGAIAGRVSTHGSLDHAARAVLEAARMHGQPHGRGTTVMSES